MIGTNFNRLTENLRSHEAILDIVKGELRETGLTKKYEKLGYEGAGADPVPGHWLIRIEPMSWSRVDLRQQSQRKQVQGSNC